MKREYKFVNTGKSVSLEDLILSGDISDVTNISIFGVEGKLIAAGNWYEDKILRYTQRVGTAQRVGSAPCYKFIIP